MSRALVPPNVVVERSGAGETYIINEKGEKLIAASRRPDGSIRKAIKVRPGFIPLEERERFVSRATAFRREVEEAKAHPPGTTEDMLQPVNKKSRKKKSAAKKAQPEAFFEIVEDTQSHTLPSNDNQASKEEAEPLEVSASSNVAPSSGASNAPLDLEGLTKRLKMTRRKLTEARALQKRQEEGHQLLPNQEEKISRILNFEEELKIVEEKIKELQIS